MGTKPKCTVQIISANKLALRYLTNALGRNPEIELSTTGKNAANVFVIDSAASDLQKTTRALSSRQPKAKFVLVARETELDPFFLLFSGIHGLVRDSEVDADLAATVLEVAKGRISFPGDIVEARLDGLDHSGAREVHWTRRERDVLALLQRRLSNREISEVLAIEESTVKFYVSEILTKLGIASRRDLWPAPIAQP